MQDSLEIRYTPEEKDYIRASRTLATRATAFWILAAVIGVVTLAAGAVLVFPGLGRPEWRNVAVVLLLVGAFYVIYYLVFIPWQLKRAYKSNEYLQRERKLRFSKNSVVMQIGDRGSDMAWEHFTRVIDAGDFYLLLYEAEDKIYPFIPKAAFEDEEAEAYFLALLAEKSIPVG
jgi:hypothetical protein